ncbi:MAG: tetratricopeptide repeat protein, partial [Candidatus Uhrbacteria bacterium]|nr:tetratricopeptide repeat protein [Candidatus Uhrbacteria bacterium]
MKRSRVVAGIAIAFFGSMAMMSGEAWGRSLEEPDSNVLIAQGHFEKSKDALGQRDYAEALRQNDLAIQAWPHPDLYYNRGYCLEQAGRLSEAIAAFKFYRSLIRKDQTKKRSLDEVNDRIKRLTDQLI